jgi:hypothetical protein
MCATYRHMSAKYVVFLDNYGFSVDKTYSTLAEAIKAGVEERTDFSVYNGNGEQVVSWTKKSGTKYYVRKRDEAR